MNEDEFRELLHKFRGEPVPHLLFQPCAEQLMDCHHCAAITRLIHKPGVMWERMKAVPDLWTQLPEVRGIYLFVWRPELMIRFSGAKEERFSWVLYVGKAGVEEGTSDTIRHRYQNEYSKYVGKDAHCLWHKSAPATREERLARYLTLRPLEYWYLEIENRNDIQLLEKRLIHLLNPPLNKQHGPKMRVGKPVPLIEEPHE